jgi:quercetin dioxygenase-like cupin family protein
MISILIMLNNMNLFTPEVVNETINEIQIDMDRRKFLSLSLISFPLITNSKFFSLNPEPGKAIVLRPNQSRFGQPTPFLGVNPNDLKVSSSDTSGRLSAYDYVGLQRVGPTLHKHLYQDEAFYVIEGSYIFQLGQEKQQLNSGDLIFLPRNIPHTWVQTSEKGKMFYFLQPSGKIEEFFLKLTDLAGKASEAEYLKLGIDTGITNSGPPLSADEKHILADRLSNGFIVRSGGSRVGEKIVLNGISPNDLKVSGKDTGSELSIFEYQGNEKGGPPLHLHYFQDEIFYIANGEYLFQCGDEKFNLGEGDLIFLPREIPHTWAQLTEKGKLLYFFQPSGKMEEFFSALSGLPASAGATEGEALFAKHDMRIVGPPLNIG